MNFYLVLALSGFLAFYLIKIKRTLFYALAEQSVSLLNNLLSNEDDDAKLELLQSSTKKLVFTLLKNVVLFVVALAVAVVPVILFSWISGLDFNEIQLSSWPSILALSIGASLPFVISFKNKNKSDYSELSQLLHRLALNNYTIGYRLFKREAKVLKKKNTKQNERFLIVTGLARAGTTSLLNGLQQTGCFSSLSYANMPFLMSPNAWRKIYNPHKGKEKERSHGDGIKIGLDSTEALEEYFFKLKANDSFIRENELKEYSLSEDDYKDYIDYQAVVKNASNKIYLAKNNNFLLRYNSVRKYNQEFIAVVLCRHPLYHAASLLEKHLSYSKLQADDAFVLEYMNWLGHYEFGLNQKSFKFKDGKQIETKNKECLNYWLEVWINYYQKALTIEDPNTILLTYEQLCNEPNEVIKSLLSKFSINETNVQLNTHKNKREVKFEYSQELLSKALDVYNKIEHVQLNRK